MLVVTYQVRGRRNCVETVAGSFVYARTGIGSFVLPATCPHRGGPLHLATLEPGRARLVCPWHGRRTAVARWLRRGVPAVRRGGTVTAVLPVPPETGHLLTHRPLSTDLDHHPESREDG